MNKAQDFIKDKVKNWKEKRFGSGGELIVHYDEVEKWLEEYAEQKVKNLAQPDVIREVCKCESDYLQCNEFGKCPKCGKDWV